MAASICLQLLLLTSYLTSARAQQYYINATGPTERPQCTASPTRSQPSYGTTSFSFTMTETVRYATSLPPGSTTPTYAAPSESLTSLVSSLSYTTWGSWDPNATVTATDTDNPYGRAAWTGLWEYANPPNFTTETSLYSTTVSATPLPSSELVLPPRDYFGPTDCYYFPEDFIFGVSSSSSQIEGATAQEGKTPTLMDILIQDDRPKDYVTNENYYLYRQDIERLAAMGVKYYSFSIAWTRILPFALPGTPVNQQGIDHYNDLINLILEKGMIPAVTIIHFETPIQFYGSNLTKANDPVEIGYTNGGYQNETFEDAFVNYAKIVMTHYSDRVPLWFTFNEPLLYCDNGKSVDHVIKAHARVYHFYKEELNGTGKVSIKFNDNFGVPRDPDSEADVYAANHFNSFQLATFCNPIFLGIDYPDSYKQTIEDYVPLTEEDLAYIGHTADYLGIDPYTATVVTPPVPGEIDSILDCASNYSNTFRPYCVNQTTVNRFGWNIGYRSQSYVYITPTYLREYLYYLWNTWHTPVLVTEFGKPPVIAPSSVPIPHSNPPTGFPVFAEAEKELSDQLFDSPRSQYYTSYMSEVLKSIWEDGVHVAGALAWSYIDNWEFGDFDSRFGLQAVNRTTQERYFKKSFFELVDFVAARRM
jgi:beta-glucosidase/6-phospho-beta-glucosidase/beta-galactosidase